MTESAELERNLQLAQTAKEKMGEAEFDARMAEIKDACSVQTPESDPGLVEVEYSIPDGPTVAEATRNNPDPYVSRNQRVDLLKTRIARTVIYFELGLIDAS